MIMEKMGGTMSIEFGGVSDKTSPTRSDNVGLGLKLQSSESLPTRMNNNHDYYHLHRQILSSKPVIGCDGDDGGDCDCGPISSSGTNEVVVMRESSGGSSSSRYSSVSHCGSNSISRTLHPIHISSSTSTNVTSFKSQGGKEANMGFPFTEAQWKELERQAMIYKYMMSSVPVPPHLLLPLSLGSGCSILNLRVSGNNKDGGEPGRCKRTDGKKWRCSRDVAPHQKYCERHLNRGRPRSRKPVELHAPPLAATKKPRLLHHQNHLPSAPSPMPVSSPRLLGSNIINPVETSLLIDKSPTETLYASSPYKEIPRGLDWIMEGEMGGETEQQWQQLMQTNIGFNVFRQDYREEELLNLISCTDFGAPQDLVPLERESQIGTPRDFIDLWSDDKKNIITESDNLSPSLTLSMAMAARNDLDEDMGHIQMGLGVTDSAHSYGISPVSWMGSDRGGPLAEALRPGTVGSGGDSISPPATTVSSSGLIQRTVASQSDSSGCNSPTLAAVPPPEMIGFKWLS